MSDFVTPASDKPRRRWRLGLAASIVVHSCLLIVLVVVPYRLYVANRGAKQNGPAGSSSAAESGNRNSAEVAANDEQSGPAPAQVVQAEKIMTDKVETELTAAVSHAEQLTSDEKLDRLDQLTEKLNQVSSEKSVDELSKKLTVWFKTEERATVPAEKPPPGEFDYDTAQFYDVKREELPDGTYRYQSVLLDSAGRTVEIELAESEGESTYRTFALFKANPLAEKLYRRVTMPLLDKLVKAAEQTANESVEPAPAEPNAESSPDQKD